jgi:signal transduction histidine kinase
LFRNLIENAVKYSPEDADVVVEVRSNPDTVTVAVTDTGVGIAREALEHLGERFYRVDASRTRPTGGTGLGLSICKSIVQAHGGTIEFQSVPGQGTTVTVHLPTHG